MGIRMDAALWVTAAFLCAAFLYAGSFMLFRPREQAVIGLDSWARSFSEPVVKVVGVVEILGALGVLFGGFFAGAALVVPISAVVLGLIMVDAFAIHSRRHETPNAVVAVVLFLLAAFTAWGRFTLWPAAPLS